MSAAPRYHFLRVSTCVSFESRCADRCTARTSRPSAKASSNSVVASATFMSITAKSCQARPLPTARPLQRAAVDNPRVSNAPLLSWLQTAVEASATLAFAISGLLEAARKRLDAVGVCLVAGLAAFGGG